MRLRIFDLQIDDWNEEEAARHNVTEQEIRQVLDNTPIFLPNKKRHAAPVIMIGPTYGGRFLTVPLRPTDIQGIWRPATAFPSSDGEIARYEAAGGS